GQASGGDRSGLTEIQPLRNSRDLVSWNGDKFGVKASLWILPIVGIDLVANLQPPDPRADRCDDSGAIVAENQWKVGLATGNQALPHFCVPRSDSGGIDRDQDVVAVEARNRQGVPGENVRPAEAIDGGRKQRARNRHAMMPKRDGLASSIEHERPRESFETE